MPHWGFTQRLQTLGAVGAGVPALTPALCPPLHVGGIRSETWSLPGHVARGGQGTREPQGDQ